jgi:hypothetical protein
MSILIPSQSSLTESHRLQQLSYSEIALEYYNLPMLPTNQEVTISKIAILNWNPVDRCSPDPLTYKMFSDIDKIAFPEGEEPQYDYMPDEAVSPVTIQDINGEKYKVPMNLWFVLSDISGGIILKQGLTLHKVFPFTVYIEENFGLQMNTKKQNWICKLMNFVGIKYINGAC